MTDQPQPYAKIKALNETALSQNVKDLFQQEQVQMESGLIVASLVMWAAQELVADADWARRAQEAVALEEADDPESLYLILDNPQLEEATSLEEAGRIAVSILADWIKPESPYRALQTNLAN